MQRRRSIARRPAIRCSTQRLAARGIDGADAAGRCRPSLFLLALFVYPFLYGLLLSFKPKDGGAARQLQRSSSPIPFLYETIATTLWLALPVTILNLLLAVPIAFRVRLMQHQRLLTTILVLPITLGTVLVAEGLLNYLGPQGWFNRTLMTVGLIDAARSSSPTITGACSLSLVITGFPFTFLLTLSYVTGIDPALEQAAATLGAERLAALPHDLPAAAAAGPRDHLLPVLRAGLLGLSLRGAARRAGRADARDLDRRLSGGLRGVRLLDGLGHRDDHGRRPARHRRRGAGARAACSIAARPAARKAESMIRDTASRRKTLGHRHLGGRSASSSSTCFAMIAHGRDELVRHALARHLAAGRLDDALVLLAPGTSSSSATC